MPESAANSMSGMADVVVQAHTIQGDVNVGIVVDPRLPLPRQLPVAAPGFVGRADQLAELDAVFEADPAGSVVISAIDGSAGIGKTTLALHWAHRAVNRFPDGQLYVNLQGFSASGDPVRPAEALQGFLNAFDLPAGSVPTDVNARAALFRSLVSDRRMLIVLDNARDVDQVRPLLPGSPLCGVIITSRNRLTGLVALDGARLMPLDVLAQEEAHELLAHRVGTDRAAAEADAVTSLTESCSGLPLALAIVGARGASEPDLPLDELVAELRDERDRLSAFHAGDENTDLQAVFSWSYKSLSPQAAELFRNLGSHPGPEIGFEAATVLGATRRLLTELTRANLLDQYVSQRYRFHDLLRLYARELGADPEPMRRLAGWYRDRVAGATAWINSRLDVEREHRTKWDALRWLEGERANLVALVMSGASAETACLLAPFFRERMHVDDWRATLGQASKTTNAVLKVRIQAEIMLYLAQTTTVEAELPLPQGIQELPPADHADVLRIVADAYLESGRIGLARKAAVDCVERLRALGNRRAEAWALANLAQLYSHQLLFDETTECLTRTQEIWRELNDPWFEADALIRQADADRLRSEVVTALRCVDRAVTLYTTTFDDQVSRARAFALYGQILREFGVAAQAIDCQLKALEILASQPEPRERAEVLAELVDTALSLGRIGVAKEFLRQLLAAGRSLNDPQARNRGFLVSLGFHSDAGDFRVPQSDDWMRGQRPAALKHGAQNLARFHAAQGRIATAVGYIIEDGSAESLMKLAEVYRSAYRDAEAVPCMVKARDLSRQLDDPKTEAVALDYLGNMYQDMGRFRVAIDMHEAAVGVRTSMGVDSYRTGWNLVDIAYCHRESGRFDDALATFERGLAVRQEAGNTYGVVQMLGMVAETHVLRREFDQAARRLSEAVALSTREMLDPAAWTLADLVHYYSQQYRFAEAEQCYWAALPTLQRQGGDRRALTLQGYFAQMRIKQGRATEAIELLRYHLDFLTAIEDFTWTAKFRADLVRALLDQRRFAEAESFARHGVEVAVRTEADRGQLRFLGLLGEIATARGQFGAAQAYFRQAADLGDRNGDGARAHHLAGLAKAQLEGGDTDAAIATCQTRLAVVRTLGDDRAVAQALAELAVAQQNPGPLDECLSVCDALEDPWAVARTLKDCARAAERMGEPSRVIEYLSRRADLGHTLFELGICAEAAADLGEHHLRHGRPAEAVRAHQQALDLREELGDPPGIADASDRLATAKAAAGRTPQ
ncbi:tetratricopeptide (TPR) repeat protein [Kibdelosporangium banguiense]|uniref:Tetratricopeptide (TPR) repeat protein n=1 Tax=Kibdelosporangium banguiense TaxID=1365924 RepID=A0ABS4TUL5_9PSEU|nr:tetratricopeptide repeat protein [Kibdelosporangium banguiense]MBP2328063.1 tetratricopeptide (TPR) repeat protein [Kibdelosporangium banguiense]